MLGRSFILAITALVAASCAPPPAACPDAPLPRDAPFAPAAAAAQAPSGPRLALDITPHAASPEVTVQVTASGAPEALRTWSIAGLAPGDVATLHASDEEGPVAFSAHPDAATVELDRAPRGGVRMQLTVAARLPVRGEESAVLVDPDRFEGRGDALFPVPSAFESTPVPVTLRIDASDIGHRESVAAASSFGFGAERTLTARGSDLRFATYLAGSVGHALFDSPEGHDEAAWLGFTAFDPRPISADVAAFRTAVRQLFRDGPPGPPLTLLIVADARRIGELRVTRRSAGVLVHVGVAEPWSAPVRISVAAEVIHRWIGGELWIGPDDAGRAAEAYWFTEGVTRSLARDLLFRFGLISPAELASEVEGLVSLAATSPLRARANRELAASVTSAGAVPLLVARGALYAMSVDARIREKSGGKRSLDDVLRDLLAKARAANAALPTAAWIDAVTAEVGAPEGPAFTSAVERGLVPRLGDGALGACFRSTKRRYEAFDLGFDEPATRSSSAHAIVDLEPGGPAARAGLRESDTFVRASFTPGRPDVAAELTVERDGRPLALRYRPAGLSAEGQGWARKRDVPDEACAR